MTIQSRAWAMSQAGGPDVLHQVQIDLPSLRAGQVLIRVVAAGFNPVDTKIRAGLAPIAPQSGVLGCDVSGYIEALGDGVSAFAVGDAVYGCAGGVKGHCGALAEYMVADAALLAPAPAGMALDECAALPVAAITAYAAFQRLQLQAGERLFVVGASGAVGLMMTQIARQQGLLVEGSAGNTDRIQRVEAYGGRGWLHSECAQLVAQGERFNKVLDTFGGTGLQTALELAAPYAQVATINARHSYDLSQAHAKALTLHAIFVLLPLLRQENMAAHGDCLRRLTSGIEAGELKGLPLQRYGMSDVTAVHSRYESGMLTNKAIMLPDF
ncbi:MAG: alcohol dehydrogenase catalytic domain-containing protein [Saccharospirillaceae bacterium]|nr:alcohol dehydrogenase catalytic domain-containing protein [Saccharospirillaceae bacterium]MCD8531683.1 alcohol dehydrogenase catalytic domain-containing protein [Saccharospirillaceae bacterium]